MNLQAYFPVSANPVPINETKVPPLEGPQFGLIEIIRISAKNKEEFIFANTLENFLPSVFASIFLG